MSASGKERRGARRNLRQACLILAVVGLTATSCGPVQVVDIDPPRLRIQYQVSSTPPPGINLYRFNWTGSWIESVGVTGEGATEASDTLNLTPTAVAQTGGLVTFPDSPALRPGRWQISAAVTENGTTYSGSCTLEIFSGLPTVVKFTEGLTDCASQVGGS